MKLRAAGTAILLSAGLTLAACGGQSGGADGGTLRVGWFGNDVRSKSIQKAITAFEAANPDITVEVQHSPFKSYWDKLATQFAASDAPDVVMMSESHLGEYAGRGALLELGDSVDTSAFDRSAVAAGETPEGRFAITAGLNAMAIMANPKLFEEAGVALPDDSTWTWQDYAEIAAEITSKSKKGVYGSSAPNLGPGLEIWLRQQGKSLYTGDGGLGYTAADATEYFEFVANLGAGKAIPPPSVIVEDDHGPQRSGLATNRNAMGWFWNSALGAINTASGQEMKLLRPPAGGEGASPGLYYKADSLWAVNARSGNAEVATKLIDFLVSSPEAGKVLRTSLGVPPNSQVREALSGTLDATGAASVEYLDRIADHLGDERPAIPPGGGVFDATIKRIGMDVLFGRQSPDEAGKALVSEMAGAIKK